MSKDPLPLEPDELERLRRGLRILALRSLGDPHLAEDVAQESLSRALEALRNGRRPRSDERFPAFVRGIARHVIADHHRRRGRTSGTPLEAIPSAAGGSPLEALVERERCRRVSRALARLSSRDREILRLSFHEGLKPSAIARKVGEPPARIRKHKSRALARLREAFFAQPPDEPGPGSHAFPPGATEVEER